MTDYFAVLNEPRRPWLDPEALKQKFLSLSATVHPDRVHGRPEAERQNAQQQYTELNAAYQCLRDTKSRLQHFLELERRAKLQDVQDIPPEMMDLFFQVGKLCRETDDFLKEKRQVNSPLLKVSMFERAQQWQARLDQLAGDLSRRVAALEEELKTGAGSSRLEPIYRLLSYYGRWRGQLQERRVQLVLD